jgi:UDP-2,3-diacylglucosamine pyrophosphatase LpxH
MIEDDKSLRAKVYERPLNYTFDSSLGGKGGKGGFYFVFNQGVLNCSKSASKYGDICIASNNKQVSVASDHPSFVYLDCGSWEDNPIGENDKNNPSKRSRDFGLVCGPHVYLCEFTGSKSAPESKVKSVKTLFEDLARNGCGVRVLEYATAKPPMANTTPNDPNLYLVLGDLHLPPVTWFYKRSEVSTIMEKRAPPAWLESVQALKRQPDYLYRNYFTLAQLDREYKRYRDGTAAPGAGGNPDIFKRAGEDLVTFISGLSNVSPQTKELLHFIQAGDMLELWLGREYQFEPGLWDPKWKSSGSINKVCDWALEILIQHTPVFEAFQKLQNAGLAEVKFLWGNHDSYTKEKNVTDQLDLPRRYPTYTGLKGDLFVEHGHRFDSSNYDNTPAGFLSGPDCANWAYKIPVVRTFEQPARAAKAVLFQTLPKQIDSNLLGATLIYLWIKYDQGKKPFNIYVMGHSHRRKLLTFNIKTDYHLYPQA